MMWSQWPEDGDGDWRGPIQIEDGRMAGALLRSSAAPRETYNVPHRVPWHWQVPAYLVTKAVGAGAFIVAVGGTSLNVLPDIPLFTTVAFAVAVVFIGITTGLLVWDLDRPSRFLSVLLRPQWKSWLARGAFVLVAFSIVASLMLLGALLGMPGVAASPLLALPGIVLAILAAVYTAFLFAQAEGRDLWQSTLLPWHMFVQSLMCGAAALLVCAVFFGVTADSLRALAPFFVATVALNLLLTVAGEFAVPHASQVASAAARMITHGRYAPAYRASIVLGGILPLALAGVALWSGAFAGEAVLLLGLAGILSVVGLCIYEYVFVMAPQQIPNN
jgi:formate-dependent nitrite reductase membrane component NrfD